MTAISWIRTQVGGWANNVKETITGTGLSDILPPSWVSVLKFFLDSFPQALGFTDEPKEHIQGVIVFSTVLVVASFTTLTVVAAIFAAIFGPLALLRLWPAVEKRWPLSSDSWFLWSISD
jgi:hypothetical protein